MKCRPIWTQDKGGKAFMCVRKGSRGGDCPTPPPWILALEKILRTPMKALCTQFNLTNQFSSLRTVSASADISAFNWEFCGWN